MVSERDSGVCSFLREVERCTLTERMKLGNRVEALKQEKKRSSKTQSYQLTPFELMYGLCFAETCIDMFFFSLRLLLPLVEIRT